MSINLQEELEKFTEENYESFILRSMKHQRCICWRKESNTPDLQCPNCKGSGFLYKESIQKAIMFVVTKPRVAHEQDFFYGKTYSNMMTAYFPLHKGKITDIKIGDLLFEIESNEEGKIKNPIVRKRKWEVTEVFIPKLDGSKAQFSKILAKPLSV